MRHVFDEAAGEYDRLEWLTALGTGSWYRRDALKRAGLATGSHVLDVAVGTGLLAREALFLVGQTGSVIGLDPDRGYARPGQTYAADPACPCSR